MAMFQYALYPPPGPGAPWLAVVLENGKPSDVVGCEDRSGAERVLLELEARMEGRAFRLRE
jgi:hypothetical protein